MTALDDALDRAMREALRPPPVLSLEAWADRYGRVPIAGNAQPGPWRPFAYQREWLRCMSDPAVKTMVVQKSARIGYTRALIHCASYYIAQDPAPVLVVLPRESDAEDFSRSEILPTLLDTPALFEICGDLRSRSSEQRVAKRVFKNGSSIAFVGANSPNSFRRISARVVLFDECDAYPADVGSEGDAIALGVKRSETFHDRRVILGSTPTIRHESRIERAFLGSDMRRFHVACPGCGHFQTLRWSNLKWDKTPAGEHLPESVYYECERSGCIIDESDKPAMIEGGRWVAEKPFVGVAGFAINTLYSLFANASWENLVREWLVACKDEVTLRTFVNTTLGEPFEQRGSARPWEELAARARLSDYKRGTVPKGAALLFLGCDCQLDRIEWMLVGRGSNNRKFVVDSGVIHWPISEADGQRALNELLRRRWTNYCGMPMSITMAAIDAGYETDHVLRFCKGRREIIAVRGTAGSYRPAIAKVKSEKHGKRGDVLRHPRDGYFTVGIDSIKSQLFVDLSKDDADAAGFIAFPSGCEDRLFQELTAEHRVAVKRMGMIVFRWEKVSDRQSNEMLDAWGLQPSGNVAAWLFVDQRRTLGRIGIAVCGSTAYAEAVAGTEARFRSTALGMTNMGTISIFALDFSGTRFAVSRSFVGGYILQAGDHTVPMTPDVAGALAGGGKRIRDRAKIAAYYKREMQSGATFRRDLRAVDGRVVHVEIGIGDAGDSVYLEIGTARVTLTDQQAALLLAVLDQLAADVDTVASAAAGPPVPNFGIAQELRSVGVPRWARLDDEW